MKQPACCDRSTVPPIGHRRSVSRTEPDQAASQQSWSAPPPMSGLHCYCPPSHFDHSRARPCVRYPTMPKRVHQVRRLLTLHALHTDARRSWLRCRVARSEPRDEPDPCEISSCVGVARSRQAELQRCLAAVTARDRRRSSSTSRERRERCDHCSACSELFLDVRMAHRGLILRACRFASSLVETRASTAASHMR